MTDKPLDTPPKLKLGERILPTGRLRPEGLDEEQIRQVVARFYAEARRDPVLGPVFNSVIPQERWPHHLAMIEDFWSSMLLGTGRYGGRPMPKHVALKETITDAHFARWLNLFKQTVDAVCEPATAALFIDRAERIGQSFRLQMAFMRGEDTTQLRPIKAE